MDEALIKSEREEECWWIAEFLRIKAMAGKRARNATRGRDDTVTAAALPEEIGARARRLSGVRGGSGARRRRARRHPHGDRATPGQPDDVCQRPANLEEPALPENRQVRAEPDSSPGPTARPIDGPARRTEGCAKLKARGSR